MGSQVHSEVCEIISEYIKVIITVIYILPLCIKVVSNILPSSNYLWALSSGQTLIFAGVLGGCRGFFKIQTLSLMILQYNWGNKINIYTHEINRKHSRW